MASTTHGDPLWRAVDRDAARTIAHVPRTESGGERSRAGRNTAERGKAVEVRGQHKNRWMDVAGPLIHVDARGGTVAAVDVPWEP